MRLYITLKIEIVENDGPRRVLISGYHLGEWKPLWLKHFPSIRIRSWVASISTLFQLWCHIRSREFRSVFIVACGNNSFKILFRVRFVCEFFSGQNKRKTTRFSHQLWILFIFWKSFRNVWRLLRLWVRNFRLVVQHFFFVANEKNQPHSSELTHLRGEWKNTVMCFVDSYRGVLSITGQKWWKINSKRNDSSFSLSTTIDWWQISN